ncbi:hypothetical protein FIBSPDRAFT_868626 [Athelia psychrophila]|uniref:Uncharacterized protein n=1 Tax=Athelia psychrophila TaxID=1759441 RepID=A0A166CV96_9AGAM|nr:hypothetical protein FIBSPDRAFT_868626 [Fibularhizoctonia sp. CBS 109695]
MGAKKQVGGYRLASDSGSAPSDESTELAQELVIKAQWHISQPSSLVAALFGGAREEEEGPDAKRLAIGLHEQPYSEEDSSNKRQVYGVWEVTQGATEPRRE